MFKRFLLAFLSFAVFFTTLLSTQTKTHAVAPVIKIVAGSTAEKIMIGIAEKAGVKYATKTAREKARDRWNMDLYEDLMAQTTPVEVKQRLEALDQAINSAEVIPIPEKPGFGKVALDAALFLTGLDLIFEVYNAFKLAYEQQKYVDGLSNSISSGTYVKIFPGYSLVKKSTGVMNGFPYTNWRLFTSVYPNSTVNVLGGYGNVDTYPFDWYFVVTSVTTARWYATLHYNYQHPEYGVQIGTKSVDILNPNISGPATVAMPITETDVPSIVEVPQPIVPLAAPGIDPIPQVEGLPDQIEIVVPIDHPYPDPATQTEPLNDPGTLIQPNPSPEPGTEPGTETGTEPGTNPFGFPVEVLSAFLCIFRAIVMYILRLVEFMVSIPSVPPRPFGNEAFEWFKNARIMGVQIYNTISTLGAIGLSVMVYRFIRRVLP